MIVGRIQDTFNYEETCLKKAIKWLGQLLLSELPIHDMRYDHEEGMYALLATIETHQQNESFEIHKKYIDIHYILSGKEVISYAPLSKLIVETAYDEEKDTQMSSGESSCICILNDDMLAVFYPGEAHQPGCHIGIQAEKIRKIIIKVPYNIETD